MDDQIRVQGRFLRFVVREGWEFADRVGMTGIVVIAAVTPQRRLVLVEQYRPPVAASVLELPAGLVGAEHDSESMLEAARRELREETGYEASRWVAAARGSVSPGTTSEVMTLYLATGLDRVGSGGGAAGEAIRVHEMPIAGAARWLAQRESEGLLVDLKIYTGLYFTGLSTALSKG